MSRQEVPKSHALPVVLAVFVLLSPLLYFLSFGPALVLHKQGMLDKHELSTLYLPLVASQHVSPPLFALAKWYGGLWVDLDTL